MYRYNQNYYNANYFDDNSMKERNFDTMNLRHSYNPYYNQRVQIQDTIKIEEQAYSNEILCRLLSTAECYYNRLMNIKNVKELFGYYNALNSGNRKDNEKLKKQFLHQIELFKSSMEDYYNNYKKYDFPNNLSEKEVINIVKQWKNNIEKEPRIRSESKYYQSILELLKYNFDQIDYRSEIKAMNKGKVNKNGDVAYQLMNNYIQEKAERISQNIKENALRGKFDINVVLNGHYKDDELFTQHQKYKNLYDTRYKNNSCINIKNNHRDIDDEKLEMKKSFNNLNKWNQTGYKYQKKESYLPHRNNEYDSRFKRTNKNY